MKTRRTCCAALGVATLALFLISPSFAYEVANHADISQTALELSNLNALDGGKFSKLIRLGLRSVALDDNNQRFPLPNGLPPIPMCFGVVRDANSAMVPNPNTQPTWNTDAGRTPLSIVNLLRYGACYEDNTEIGDLRSLAHFYDPQNAGAGLAVGPSSPDWMLQRGNGNAGTGANHYTWQDARDAMHEALTRNSGLASVSAADNDILRKLAWAKTFQALGHLVHHLQDMAQPQHVRNDDHCDALPCRAGVFKPSGYEKHLLNNRLAFVQQLAATASAPMMFGLPREFWNATVPTGQPLTGAPNLQGHMPSSLGIAAYTSTNFVSAATDFVGGTTDGVTVWGQRADHPYPQAANELRHVSLAELFANADPSTLTGVARDLCGGNAATCYMQFVGTQADPQAKTSALSTFGQALLRPEGAFSPSNISGGIGIFQQNFFTYDDAARKLVPRAVEYSAGLINYFFRGEMEISLPEEGVYGIVDHAVEKTKGSDGFRFIKMRVRNTTADIVTSNRGAIAQPMSAGQFVAVAKFRRNSCYTSDLKGQIGRVGRGASMIVNDYATCRTAVEEIVVSAPGIDPQGTVTELSAGAAREMSFDFSTNPIPIEAIDLYLQVVFKGTLGEELGAVAVTTRSISEPSFLTNLDSFDVQPCATSEAGICRTITAPANTVDFSPCVPNDADARPCLRRGRNYGGRERYLGFNPDIAATRVVEWYGAKSDSIDPVYFERDANNYYRVAVLADVERAPRTITWSLADDSASKWIRQGDVPVVFGQFRQLTGTGATYIPTPSQLTPAYSRFPATRVKANVDDTAPTLDSLPQYAVVRGVVVGVDLDRTDDPDALPFLFNSPGDNVRWADWADGTLHPANRTLYERAPDLPGGSSAQPVAVKAIRFGNTPAYRLPAPTTAELEDMASDIYQARYWQPRMVRTQGLPQGYHWSVQ